MSEGSRVAVCLYGRFNNRFTTSAGIEGAKYIHAKLLSRYDCDLFVFSTDVEESQSITRQYGDIARRLVMQEAPDFSAVLRENGIHEEDFSPLEGFRTAANTLSFLYNRKGSLDLLAEELSATPNQYTSAITCRFDVAQIDKFNGTQPFRVSEFNFDPRRDMRFLYSAAWNQLNAGFADQWFYSSPQQLLVLRDMYEETLRYLQRGSSYWNMLKIGIPDSNPGDPFSNELLRPRERRSRSLVHRDWDKAVDNHLLHKWFFIDKGIYERCRFTSNVEQTGHVLYTHTDYADVWPMYFGQEQKYFSAFEENYVLVNERSSEIPAHYRQIIYDDGLPYVDRLISGLEQINCDVMFFDHEDMILLDTPKFSCIQVYANLVRHVGAKRGRSRQLDFVRLVRGGRNFRLPYLRGPHLKLLLQVSPWIFSIQPSLWNKQRLLELLRKHQGQPIWEFEEAAQATSRKLRIRGAYVSTRGGKRGKYHWDNEVYPYIATAIVKGKWNVSEYRAELDPLFTEYGIDPHVRGGTAPS